ncbi:MAG: uracil-DNA glycosylase family protein [Pseudomonadota bacterium]
MSGTADPPRNDLVAALTWQVELGADEAIGEHGIDRFAATAKAQAEPPADTAPTDIAPVVEGQGERAPAASQRPASTPPPRKSAATPDPSPGGPPDGGQLGSAAGTGDQGDDDLATATDLTTLARLGEAMDAPTLKPAARRFVFADGNPAARLMIVGEAPGADEDRLGRPFVGRAGQLLDRMLAAIGLDRTAADPARAVYIANILPWRPAGNRTPTGEEIALFLPLIERHIALAAPERLLLLGNTPLKALTGSSTGITRARGRWMEHRGTGISTMASFHPAYLLRSPDKKREAWADLLAVAAALDLPYPVA